MATNRPGELERFRDLPPELFSKILRSRADTGVLLSEINTATAKKAERGYLYEECATKISRKEIIDELAIVSKRRGGDVLLNLQPGKFEPSFIVMIGSSVLSDIILRRARIPEMRRGYFYEQLDLVSLRLRPKSYAVNVSHDMGMMANVFLPTIPSRQYRRTSVLMWCPACSPRMRSGRSVEVACGVTISTLTAKWSSSTTGKWLPTSPIT